MATNAEALSSMVDNILKDEEESTELGLKELCQDNVVTKDKLRKIQGKTLDKLSQFISATYGPLGSNTMIVTGSDKNTILSNYSKDGLKVLKNITFNQPLEMAIHSEIEDIARFVEHQVGDGTTSSVIISASVFKGLSKLEKESNIPPRALIKAFQDCVKNIQENITKKKRDITLEDIYKICLISTNGNKEVSDMISQVYKDYGFDVSIDVGISNDVNTKLKIYDGLTIGEGYSDPAYINNNINGTAEIKGEGTQGARIYAFSDPIDTPEMISFMEKIIMDNIITPFGEERLNEMIPTVIISPHISRDASGLLTKLVTLLYSYNKDNLQNQKPPILVLTNISGTDEDIYLDIANLCRCKMIKKYIDPNIQKADQEKGDAPTIETITEWYGTADEVIADGDKTKFINPAAMADESDNTYDMLLNFLKAEIKKAEDENTDHTTIGRLKKRLRHLEANMVEYLIGGITISDRDSLKDLVEDAVKNCASAVVNGVGFAANYEGLRSSYELLNDDDSIASKIYNIIFAAYYNAAKILYTSALSNSNDVEEIILKSLQDNHPYNIMDIFNEIESDGSDVLCSINTDIEILNAISKIITIMVTANQSLVQTPALNRY